MSKPVSYEFGPFRIDTLQRVLLRGTQMVTLTPKVFETLLTLVQNSGRVLDKDQIMKEVWPESFVEEGNLTQNVSILRKVLGESPNGNGYIVTIPRRGYLFAAQVRELREESADLIVKEPLKSSVIVKSEGTQANAVRNGEERHGLFQQPDIPASDSVPLRSPRRLFSRWRLSLLAVGVFLAVVAGAWTLSYFWLPRKPTPLGTQVKSIAILPFRFIGTDERDQYLGLGMADTLITKLSNTKQVIVRPTSAITRYAGQEKDSVTVGREQRVDAVLEGNLRRSGDTVRVTVQFLSVSDGRPIWADKFEEKFTDIFAVEDLIAERLAGVLVLKLNADERKLLAKRYTDNTEAFVLYQQGHEYLRRRTRAGVRRSIEYFEGALKMDPAYAQAYVGLARAYQDSSSPSPPKESRIKVASLLQDALKLDDSLAEAHAALGALRQEEDNWEAAESEFKRALELDSNSVYAHTAYTHFLSAIGRHDEAIALAKRALDLDPLSPQITANVARRFSDARQYDRSIEQFRKALDMDPNYAPAHTNLGGVYLAKEMYEEAIVALEKARVLDNSTERRRSALLAYAYGRSGKHTEARKILDEMQKSSTERHIPPMNFAIIYTGLGATDLAFEWLERAYKDRQGPPYLTIYPPVFDCLRQDPRFADFARRKGLLP